MKKSAVVSRKEQAAQVSNQFMALAAEVYKAGMTDTFKAEPDEHFHDALVRCIDQRIREQRWYRRLWRRAYGLLDASGQGGL